MTACPKCKSHDNKVADSRLRSIGNELVTRRRRWCSDCDCRFNTIEIGEEYLQRIKDMEFGGYIKALNALKKMKAIIKEAGV